MAEHAHDDRLARWRAWPWRHSGGDEARHLLSTKAGRFLVGAVAAIAVLTAIGLAALWPYGWHATGAGNVARTIPATVERVIDKPCAPPAPELCRTIVVSVEGRHATMGLTLTRLAPRLGPGDAVRVTRPGRSDVQPPPGRFVHYEFVEVDRHGSLLWLGVLVAVLAAALLRWRGVLAVVGVVLSLAIVVWFLVPAILAGRPALLVALVAALAVMFVTLVLTNGVGAQTLAAALGISATLGLTCLLAAVAVRYTNLGTATDLGLLPVRARSGSLSLRGITLAAMLIGALGVLADTAVTQASAVMALRRANPRYDARRLYREAFTIGRDHLSATIHTLVLAYAGAVLPVLLVLRSVQVDAIDAVNRQTIAEPIVATAVGCLALIIAVPLATGLAAVLVARLPVDVVPDAHHH
jgi:uncharacterized membrane protein